MEEKLKKTTLAYNSKNTNSDHQNLSEKMEAILFSSPKPMEINVLKKITSAGHDEIRNCVRELNAFYLETGRSFEIVHVANGFQMRTRPKFADLIKKSETVKIRRFSRAALETLSIIAFRQPVSRGEIEKIRTVSSDNVIKTLLEKELIRISGKKKDLPGQPMAFSTTDYFLEVFGLASLTDLPRPFEIELLPESEEVLIQ